VKLTKRLTYIAILIVGFIAVITIADRIWSFSKWEGGLDAMSAFWFLVYGSIAVFSGFYYVFTRDKSESLFILLMPTVLLQFGLEDVFYYFVTWQPISATLPWLKGIPLFIANTLRLQVVTNYSLLISVGIGVLIVAFLYDKLLEWD